MEQQQSHRVTTTEVLQRIRAELAMPENSSSPFAQEMAHLREAQQRFTVEPIGGRLLPLKKLAFWLVASAFDRQGKVIEELLDVLEEVGRENERLQEQMSELTHRLTAGDSR